MDLTQGTTAPCIQDGQTVRFKGVLGATAGPDTKHLVSLPKMCFAKVAKLAIKAQKFTVEGSFALKEQALGSHIAVHLQGLFATAQDTVDVELATLGITKHTVTPKDGRNTFEVTSMEPTFVVSTPNNTTLHPHIVTAIFCLFQTEIDGKKDPVCFHPTGTHDDQRSQYQLVWRHAALSMEETIKPLVRKLTEFDVHPGTWFTDHLLAALAAKGHMNLAVTVKWQPYVNSTNDDVVAPAPTVFALNDDTLCVLDDILWLAINYHTGGEPGTLEVGTPMAQDQQVTYQRRERTYKPDAYPDVQQERTTRIFVQGLPRGTASEDNDNIITQLLNHIACDTQTYIGLLVEHGAEVIARGIWDAAVAATNNGASTANITPETALGFHGVYAWQKNGQTTGNGGAVCSSGLAEKLFLHDVRVQHNQTVHTLTFSRPRGTENRGNGDSGGGGSGGGGSGGGGSGAKPAPHTTKKRPALPSRHNRDRKREAKAVPAPAAPETLDVASAQNIKAVKKALKEFAAKANQRLEGIDNSSARAWSASVQFEPRNVSAQYLEAQLTQLATLATHTINAHNLAYFLLYEVTAITDASPTAAAGKLLCQAIMWRHTNPNHKRDLSKSMTVLLHHIKLAPTDNPLEKLEELWDSTCRPADDAPTTHSDWLKSSKRAAILSLWDLVEAHSDTLKLSRAWWMRLTEGPSDSDADDTEPHFMPELRYMYCPRSRARRDYLNTVSSTLDKLHTLLQDNTFPLNLAMCKIKAYGGLKKPLKDGELSIFWTSDLGSKLKTEITGNQSVNFSMGLYFLTMLSSHAAINQEGEPQATTMEQAMRQISHLQDPTTENIWDDKTRHTACAIIGILHITKADDDMDYNDYAHITTCRNCTNDDDSNEDSNDENDNDADDTKMED
jgi:hypothetical protein